MKNLIRKILKLLVGLIPKKNNLVLFSSWFGQKYSDNSKVVFENLVQNKGIESFWYTKNKELYRKLKKEKISVLYSKSIRGFWYQVRANIIVSTVGLSDYNSLWLSNVKHINLWHGIPLKMIGFDQFKDKDSKTFKYFKKANDISSLNIDEYMISTSFKFSKIYSNAFNLPMEKIFVLGQPRNDIFGRDSDEKNLQNYISKLKSYDKVILYMPTHRSDGKIPQNINQLIDLNEINCLCQKCNALFIIKKHYYHAHEIEDFDQYENVIDLTRENIDTQILLKKTDILITDYSSCYLDFLLLDRPIIHFAYDLQNYLEKERNLYFNYFESTAGKICETSTELNEHLRSLLIDKIDLYKLTRRQKRYFFYDNPDDFNSTLKVCNFIQYLIEQKSN